MIYFTWIPCPTRRVLKEFMSFKKNFTCTLNVKVVIGWYNFDSTHIVNNNNLRCSGYKMCTPRTMIQDSADPLLSEDPLLPADPLLSEDPLLGTSLCLKNYNLVLFHVTHSTIWANQSRSTHLFVEKQNSITYEKNRYKLYITSAYLFLAWMCMCLLTFCTLHAMIISINYLSLSGKKANQELLFHQL